MSSVNPLRQYFRRPAIYMRLPSGGMGYRPGVLGQTETGEYPVYPMTAIDEITANTPDALFNGQAVTDIIKSCIPGILDPWSLAGTDLDAALVAIRIASSGAKMEIQTDCPQCATNTKFDINLPGVLNSLQPGDYSTEFVHDDLRFKFRPLTYREINAVNTNQFNIQKSLTDIETAQDLNERARISRELMLAITDITIQMIASMTEYVATPDSRVTDSNMIYEYLKNCEKGTFEKIRDHITGLKSLSEIKPFEVDCPECKHHYQQEFTLNVTNFFGQGS